MKKTPELIEEEKQQGQALPINRKQLLSVCFRKHYSVILYVSLFMTLFSLPFIFVLVMTIAQLASYSGVEGEELVMLQYQLRGWFYLWSIPSTCVMSIGASGCFYAIKNLCWNEYGKFIKDFGQGVKENAVKYLLLTLLFSLFVSGVCYLFDFLTLNFNLGFGRVILLVLQVFLILVALAMLLFQYCGAILYKANVYELIKNSFKLAFGTLPRTLLMLVVSFAPVLLILLVWQWSWAYIIAITVLALIGCGYTILMCTLHCHYVYDKYVNKTQFPQIYRKGLFIASEGQPD